MCIALRLSKLLFIFVSFLCACFSAGTKQIPSPSLQRTNSADFRVQTLPISHSLRPNVSLTAWNRMRKCKPTRTETQTVFANLAKCFKFLKKNISMKHFKKEEEEDEGQDIFGKYDRKDERQDKMGLLLLACQP